MINSYSQEPDAFFLSQLKKFFEWCVFADAWGILFSSGCCANRLMHLPEKYSIPIENNPRKADVLIITGAISNKSAPVLRRTYEQMPRPKKVIAIGNCAVNGGIFNHTYASTDGAELFVPVDVKIEGCPPSVQAIINGLKSLKGSS